MSSNQTRLVPADRHNLAEEIRSIVPFIVLVDISGSMCQVEPALNQALTALPAELAQVPWVAAAVELGVITFNHEAVEHQPLTRATHDQTIPAITCGGGTDYAAAFELLDQVLQRETARIAADGHGVRRPVVFMLTDGNPNSDADWQTPLHRLNNRTNRDGVPMHPSLFAFGYGQVNDDILAQVANTAGFRFDHQQPDRSISCGFPAEVLGDIISTMARCKLDINEVVPDSVTVLAPTNVSASSGKP